MLEKRLRELQMTCGEEYWRRVYVERVYREVRRERNNGGVLDVTRMLCFYVADMF